MPPVVDRHNAEAISFEKAYPTGLDPVVLCAGCKTMDQQHRVARTFVDEGEANSIGEKTLHIHALQPGFVGSPAAGQGSAWASDSLTPIILGPHRLSFDRAFCLGAIGHAHGSFPRTAFRQ